MTTKDATSYAPGDWIVHCHHGVGQIKDIERKRIGHQENTYFRVKTSDSTIWIPVDQVDDGQIRPLKNVTHFREAVEVLNRPPREMASNMKTRESRIKQVIVNNVPIETARLIRDLRAKRRTKSGLNQSERRALRDLTKRFVQEWALCKGMPFERARQKFSRKSSEGSVATRNYSSPDPKGRGKDDDTPLLETLIRQDHKWAKWLSQQVAKGM